MKCKNCGYEFDSEYKECPECGYDNGIAKYINKKNVAIAGGSMLAAGISAVGLSKSFKNNNNNVKAELTPNVDQNNNNIEEIIDLNDDFDYKEIKNEDIVLNDDDLKELQSNIENNKKTDYNDSLIIDNNKKKYSKKKVSSNNIDDEKENEIEENKKEVKKPEENKEKEEKKENEKEKGKEEEKEKEKEKEKEEEKEEEKEKGKEKTKERAPGGGGDGGSSGGSSSGGSSAGGGDSSFYFNYLYVMSGIKALSEVSECKSGACNAGNIGNMLSSVFSNQANNTFSYKGITSNPNNINGMNNVGAYNRFAGSGGFLEKALECLNDAWTNATKDMTFEEVENLINISLVESMGSSNNYDEESYLNMLVDLGYVNNTDEAREYISNSAAAAVAYSQRAADETQKADYDHTKSLSFRLTKILTGKSLSESDVIALEQGRLDRVAAGLWVGLGNQLFENGLMGDNRTTLEDFSMQQLINGMQDENGYIDPNTKTDEQKLLEKVVYGSEIGKASGANEEALSLIQNSINQYYDSEKQYYPGDHIYDLLQTGIIAGYFDEQGEVVPFEERYVYNDPENKNIANVSDAQGYEFINWNVDMYHSIVENRSVEHRLIVNPFEEQFIRTYDCYDVALPNYNIALELVDYDNLLGTGNLDVPSDEQIAKALTMIGTVPITESQYTDEEYKKIVENAKVAAEQFAQARLNLETYYKMWCSEYDGVNPYQEFIGNNINQIISENNDTIFDEETGKLNYDMLFQLFDEVESNCSTKKGSSFMDIYLDMVNNGNCDDYVHKDAKLSIDATYGTKYGDLQTLTYIKNIDENNTEMITFGDELAASLSCGYADKMLFLNNMNSIFDYNTMRLEYANVYGEYLKAKANYEYQRDYVDPYDWTGSENARSQALKDEQERHKGLVDIASDKFGDAYFNYIIDVNSQKELRMEFIELKNSYAVSFPDNDTFKLIPDEEIFIEEYNREHYNHSEISIIDGYLGEAYEELKDCKTEEALLSNMQIINDYISEKQNKTLMLMTEVVDMNENNYQGVIASCEYSGVDSFSGAPLGLLFRDSQGNEIQPSSEDIAIYMSLNPEDYYEYGLYLSVNERDYTTALMESSEFMRRAISYISVNKPQEDFEGYFKSLVESGNFSLAKQSAAATQAEYEQRKGLGDFFLTVEEFIKAGGNQIKYGWVNLVDADGIKNRVDYHNMLVSSYLSEENKFLYHTYNVGTSIVNMVPTMALSLIPVAGPYLGSAFMWATSTGNATEGFMQEGMPKGAAYICGMISGTLEVTLQAIFGSKFFGGIKLNFAKDAIKEMMGATVKGTLTTLAYDRVIDALGEGFEEFSQEVIGTWISNLYMGLSGEHKNIKNIINSGNEQEIKELFYRECYEQYMQEVNSRNNPNLADSEITFNTYLSFNNWLLLNQAAINNGTLALIKDGERVDYSDWFKTQNEYSSQKIGGLKGYFDWYVDNRESVDWGAAIQSGLYGAATSLIMGMPSTGVQTVSYIKTGNTDTYSNFMQNRLKNSNFNIIQNMGALFNYAKALSSAGITDVNQYTQQIMSDPKFNTMYESYKSATQKQSKDTISREEMALRMFTDVFSKMEASEIAGINMDYLRTAMTSASTTKFHLEEVESRIQQLTEEYNNIKNNTEMSPEEKRTKLNEIKQELTTLKEGRRNLRQQLKQQKLAVEKEMKNNKAFTDYSEITDAELSTLIEETTKAISAKEEQIQRNNNKIKEQEAIIESTSHGFIASNGKPATKAQKSINQLKAENEILEAELSELQSELPQLKINDLLRNPEKGLSSLTDSEFNYFISNATTKMLDLFSDEIIGRLSSVSESDIQALYNKVSVAFTNIYKHELISNLDSITDETIRNALLENINSRITPEKFYEGILDTYTGLYEYLNLIEANTEKPGLITWIKGLVNKAKNSLSKESTENNEAQKIAQRNEMVERIDAQIDQTIENLEQEIKNLSIANDNLTRNKDNKSKEEIKEEIAKNKERKAKLESEIEQLKSIKKQIAKLTDSTIKLTDLNNEVFNYLVNSMSQENITMFIEEIISKLDILSNESFSNLISKMSIDTIYKYSESLLQRTEKISDKKFKDLKQKVKDNIDKAINDYVTVRTSVEEVTGEDITTKFNIIQLIKNKIDGIKLSREERLAKIEECRSQLKTTTIENINSRITQLNQEIQSIDESNKTSKDKVRKELQRKTKLESEIKSLESIKSEIDKVLGDSKGRISKLSNEAFNYLYENMSQEEIQLFSKDIIKRLETLSNENFKDFVEKIDEETVYDYKSNLITRAAAIIKDPSNRNYITELIESKSNTYKESNIESTTKTTTENIVEAESTTETEVNTDESIETKTTEDTKTTTEVVVETDTSVDTNTDISTTLSPVVLQIVEKLKSIKILEPAIKELMQKGSLKQLSSESLNLIIGNLDYNTLNNKDVLNEVIESIDKISNSGVLGIISNLSKENLSTLAPNETNPTIESISKNNENILTNRINGITSETVRVLTQTVLIQQMITHGLVSPNKTVNQQKMIEMMKNSTTPLESIMDVLNDPSINSTEKIKLLTTVLSNFIKTETKLLGNIEARTKELINSAHDAILKLGPKTQFDILKAKLNNMSSTIKSRLQPVQALIQKISNIPQDIKTKVESIAKAYHVLLEDISSCLSKLTAAKVDSKSKFVVETETENKVETVESNEIELDTPETVDLESSDIDADTIQLYDTILKTQKLNEVRLSKPQFTAMVEGLTVKQQQELITSVLQRMINGEQIATGTYEIIFESKLFEANSDFAQKYLHDIIETGIDLGNGTRIEGSKEMADFVSDVYKYARESTRTRKNMNQLLSYCDHTEAHVLQVAFLTVNSLRTLAETTGKTYTAKEYSEMFYAGLFHDLGMAAGMFNENGIAYFQGINMGVKHDLGALTKLLPELIKANDKKLAKYVRENHTLNSALIVLSQRTRLEAMGLDADKIALLCFSHSKSNSGVGKLDQETDWAFSIDKIQSAIMKYKAATGIELTFDVSKFGVQLTEKVQTYSTQKVLGGPKVQVNTTEFIFKDGMMEELSTKGLALRVGDAYVTKARIELDTPVRWMSPDGKLHESSVLVLTQTGAYMAYDPTVTALYDGTGRQVNSDETEVREAGGFAYFWMGEDGKPYPWNPKSETGISKATTVVEHKGERVSVFTNPNLMYAGAVESKIDLQVTEELIKCQNGTGKGIFAYKVKDGVRTYYQLEKIDDGVYAYVQVGTVAETSPNLSTLTAKYGQPTSQIAEKVTVCIKGFETNVTTNGYHFSETKVKNPDGTETVYKTYYKQLDSGLYKEIKTVQEGTRAARRAERRYGSPELSSTGKYLVGEHNVRYVLSTKDGKLVSTFNITDINRFPFNTISKGIVERFGELATAGKNIANAIRVEVSDAQFNEVFMQTEKGTYTARPGKETIADAYIRELSKAINEGISTPDITINGINIKKFELSQNNSNKVSN